MDDDAISRVSGPRRTALEGLDVAVSRRRLLWYGGLVLGIVVGYTLLYNVAMATFENEPKSMLHSLMVVVETFTTIGFGTDAPWESGGMQAVMIAMQLTGVSLVFLAFPLFVAPWVEDRLSTTVPTDVDLTDHVVLCGLSSRGETLIDELGTWDHGYVIVEPDYDRARRLQERDLTVIQGDLDSVDALRGANVHEAAAVVADASDDTTASVVLSVREASDDVHVVAVVEEPDMVEYLRYAGADEVYSPRQLLGESLANEVTSAVSTQLGETVEIGADFELVELPVQAGSSIAGQRLEASGIREASGANVVGLWQEGQFVPGPDPETILAEETTLLVAGTEEQLSRLKRMTLSDAVRHARGTVVVAGHGEVGETVRRHIAESRMSGIVIDVEADPSVDVVGDATESATLRKASIEDAEALVLALGDDTATMLATLVSRELSDDLRIVARVDETQNAPKVRRAGADYVVALATVSGRMIASGVLDEDVIAPEGRVEIVRTAAPRLAGETLAGADVRSRTGCTVVAVEREGTIETDLDPSFTFHVDDTLVVAGDDDAIDRFNAFAHETGGD